MPLIYWGTKLMYLIVIVFFYVLLNASTNHSETTIKTQHLDTRAEHQFAKLSDSIDPNIFYHSINKMVDAFNSELDVLLDRVAPVETSKRSCSKVCALYEQK